MDGDIEETAWTYFAVCVPIVVFFAPFGSFLSSHFHRQVLAALIYVLDTVALVRKYMHSLCFKSNTVKKRLISHFEHFVVVA